MLEQVINLTDLRIRPMYHRLRNRIEGHICICFCAYVLQLELERLLKAAGSDITIDKARMLRFKHYVTRVFSGLNKRPPIPTN